MSKECDIIRDLLPLYADEVVSDASREIIEEHLSGCPECRDYLNKLKESELESDLKREKSAVIEYGAKRFKRRSAAVGSAVSGAFMIPILALLAVNNPIAVIFTGIFMSMLNIIGLQMSNLTAYNEYLTDIIVAVIVYLSAFALVIRMLFESRRKKAPAREKKPKPDVAGERKGGERA